MNTLPQYGRNGSLLIAVLPLIKEYLRVRTLVSIAMSKKDWLWPALSLLMERVRIQSIQHYCLFIKTPHLALLRHLDMSNVPESFAVSMDNEWMSHLFLNAQHLHSLNLSNCPLLSDISKLPQSQLKHLNLSSNQLNLRDLSNLLQACPSLETLHLSDVSIVNDDTMKIISQNCPQLSHLSLKNAYVTLQGMSLICQQLTRLSLKECTKLHGSFLIHIKSLKTLIMNQCSLIKTEHLNEFIHSLDYKKDSTKLIHLDISGNNQLSLNAAVLERLALAFPHLLRLKLSYHMLSTADSIEQYCVAFSRFKTLQCLILDGLQETASADLIWKIALSVPHIRSIVLYRDSNERDFITTSMYANANLRGNAVDEYFVKSFNDVHGKQGIFMELLRLALF